MFVIIVIIVIVIVSMDSIINNNEDNNVIIRLLEAGLFEYLQTSSIFGLLQSSRFLNSFTGIAISYHC